MQNRLLQTKSIGLRQIGFFALFLGMASLIASATSAVAAPEGKIKVLIVDGYSNHDWQQNTALLRGILEPTGLFAVTVSTTPPPTATSGWDTWRPRFKDYDAVIQTCNDINGSGPAWPKAVQTDFASYVREGGGVYIYHSAQNAFAGWPEYNEIIGLGWRPQTCGSAISIGAGEKLITYPPGQGSATGHAPNGNAVVHLLGEHPIHAGVPKAWLTPHLEVYYFARGPAANVQVLSYARDPAFGQNWPVEWTVTYGKGHAYIATFGHVWKGDVQPESLRCAGVQTMIVRALQWLAGRPVTFPVPEDFPTAEKTSIRPEIPMPAPVK
jgi:type 1 glutamine amidotransferase